MAVRVARGSTALFRWQCLRYSSIDTQANVGIKERMRKFILENPYLSPPKADGLNVPATRVASVLQEDLYYQLDSLDVDNQPRYLELAPNSRENPLLVGGDEERRAMRCMCFPEVNYMRTLVLYRDMPYRCQCGNWFKLVDMERFEQAREEKWQKIKDEPENAQLLKELAETEEELNQLFQKGRGMTMYTRGATEVTEKLSVAWKRYRKIFLAIRKKMDIP
ncbi:hypothetical protein CSKR_112279 [Clonorchis sinensis]|uniref:Cytochrome c oxidase subunit 5B mitochondrial n=1 Tax=Clonorchis sinensis TaxID=79923 RepID=A0A8T1M1V6_CLOSI|nr:hypothetical protein CSKR_112279 [Clonorchis sinensis]